MKHYAIRHTNVKGSTPALRIMEYDDQTNCGRWLDENGIPLLPELYNYNHITLHSLEAFKNWIDCYSDLWTYVGTTLGKDLQVDEGL